MQKYSYPGDKFLLFAPDGDQVQWSIGALLLVTYMGITMA